MARSAEHSPQAIRVLDLRFGRFEQVSRLNARFVAGHLRLKLTTEISRPRPAAADTPADCAGRLIELFPSLGEHQCCGGSRIRETLFKRGQHHACATRAADDAVDLAHLLEHLIIDMQHAVAKMRICSGITCGYESPRSRCDVFIESPGEEVSRLCVRLGVLLLNEVLRGEAPPPSHRQVIRLATHIHGNPFALVTIPGASAWLGGDARQAAAGLATLASLNFLEMLDTSVNFSRVPVYLMAKHHDPTTESLT